MGLIKLATRKRSTEAGSLSMGALGTIQRSIGYLQGGYKGATVQSKVQLFNTNTQVGAIVYDTGYQMNYRPGISGNYSGYFAISNTIAYNKFNYITSSAGVAFNTTTFPSVSVTDLNVYSNAWLLSTSYASWSGGVIDSVWYQINLTNETPVSNGNLSTTPQGTTRQALGSSTHGFFFSYTYQNITVLNFTTKAVTNGITSALLNSGFGVACGMSVSDTKGYFIGTVGNTRLSMVGGTITGCVSATGYTYQFGESHSISSDTSGYMMAGYADTTGRYGGTQHGLCQKITFSNEAITTLPDLVLPQSSGQMMQGF